MSLPLLIACVMLQEPYQGHLMAHDMVSMEVKRGHGSSMGCGCNGDWEEARLRVNYVRIK